MTEVVRTRYGKFLTEEQLKDVKTRVLRDLRISERLKTVKLTNGDLPIGVYIIDNYI